MRKIILLIILLISVSVNLYSQTGTTPKIIYWKPDKTACPICDEITIDGNVFSIFKTPEFVLAVSGVDHGKWITANVYLFNQSNERIEFDPNKSVIAFYKDDFTKPFVEFNPMSPEIAAKKTKGGNLLNFFTLFAAGMATQQVQTNSQTNGTASIIGSGGFANGTYNETTTSTSTVSDPNAKANAQRIVAERQAIAQKKADSVLDWALRANTIFPNREIFGNIYFERKKSKASLMGIAIGDSLYTICFSELK